MVNILPYLLTSFTSAAENLIVVIDNMLTLFTMGFLGMYSHSHYVALCHLPLKISKTEDDISMKFSSQKHASLASIVCLFSCLVCVK